jgi:hypothetical protein
MTTKLPPSSYLPLWTAAAEQEIGIHITCVPEDQQKLIQAIYEAKKLSDEFDDFIVMQPQPPGTIYIMRKTVEMPT